MPEFGQFLFLEIEIVPNWKLLPCLPWPINYGEVLEFPLCCELWQNIVF
jgi:hypothetical protein